MRELDKRMTLFETDITRKLQNFPSLNRFERVVTIYDEKIGECLKELMHNGKRMENLQNEVEDDIENLTKKVQTCNFELL